MYFSYFCALPFCCLCFLGRSAAAPPARRPRIGVSSEGAACRDPAPGDLPTGGQRHTTRKERSSTGGWHLAPARRLVGVAREWHIQT